MLTLTENATSVVKTISGQATETETAGLRIAATDPSTNELNLSLANNPEPDDQVIETAGARVYLEPTASTILDDKVLDAHVEENGSVSFAIGRQA